MNRKWFGVFVLTSVLLATSAQAHGKAPAHTWFNINYGNGSCERSRATPEQFELMASGPLGRSMGMTADPISPDDVQKDGKGNIQFHVDAARNGTPVGADFFTSKEACDQFVVDQGIKPEQASESDIN